MADPFHLNADYMKGALYEGRRRFLTHADDDSKGSLKPPLEFMTKQQARVALKIARDNATKTVDFNYVLHIKNAHSASKSSDDSRPHGGETKHQKHVAEKANKRTGKQKRKDVIIVEEFSSLRPEDWTELNQAGVKAWVNHSTGEVTGVCPWKAYGDPSRDSGASNSAVATDANGGSDEVVVGTGSVVYDSSEFDRFMDTLDELAEKEGVRK